jgi:hypothetical protein
MVEQITPKSMTLMNTPKRAFAILAMLLCGAASLFADHYKILTWEYNSREQEYFDEEGRYFCWAVGIVRIDDRNVQPYEAFEISSTDGYETQEFLDPNLATGYYPLQPYFWRCCSEDGAVFWIESFNCVWAAPEAANMLGWVFPDYAPFDGPGSTLGYGPFDGLQSEAFDENLYVY